MWGKRIPDSAYGKKNDECDFILFNNGIFAGVECKMNSSDNRKSIAFDRLTEEQKRGLMEINDLGGKGWILTNFRWMGTGNDKGKCFAWTITHHLYLWQALDRKSIPIDYLQENTLCVPKLKLDKGFGWDLRVLFN